MEQPALSTYANEIVYQRQIAQWAFRAMQEAMAAHSVAIRRVHELVAGRPGPLPDAVTASTRPVMLDAIKASVRGLMALQSMLTSAGIVSWILWPNPKKYGSKPEDRRRRRVARGDVLRAMLDVPDDSPLHVIPKGADDVRGGLLHVDEILDDYVARFPDQGVDSFAFGTLDPALGWDPAKVVRVLDDSRWVARIGDRQIELTHIDSELSRVANRLRADLKVTTLEIPRMGGGGIGAFSMMGASDPK